MGDCAVSCVLASRPDGLERRGCRFVIKLELQNYYHFLARYLPTAPNNCAVKRRTSVMRQKIWQLSGQSPKCFCSTTGPTRQIVLPRISVADARSAVV